MIALSCVVVLLVFGMIGAWVEIFSLTQWRAGQMNDGLGGTFERLVRLQSRADKLESFAAIPPPKSEAEKLENYKRRLLVALGEDPSSQDSVDPLVLVETMRLQYRQLLEEAAKLNGAPAAEKPKRKRKPRATPQPAPPSEQAQQVELVEQAARAVERAEAAVLQEVGS